MNDPTAMQPTPNQRKQIEDALLDGFDRGELERVLSLEMDERLDHVAGGDTLTEVVHSLVEWAERQGRLAELIGAAQRANPNNAEIDALVRDAAGWAETPTMHVAKPSVSSAAARSWAKPALAAIGFVAILVVLVLLVTRLNPSPQTTTIQNGEPAPSPTVHAVEEPAAEPPTTTVRACADARRCVLVAALHPPDDPQAGEISARVLAELAGGDLLPAELFNVQAVEAKTSAEEVRQLAADEGAQIIVWGQIFRTLEELIVHFELANQLGVDQSNQLRPYRVQFFESVAPELTCAGECFAAASLRQAIDQLGEVIAHMAAGMLHYGLGQAEEADRDFGIALYCLGEPVETEGLNLSNVDCSPELKIERFNTGSLLYYAGRAKLLIGDYATALAYLQEAAAQLPDDPAPLIGVADVYRSWLDDEESPEFFEALGEATDRANALRTQLVDRAASAAEIAAVDYELGFIAEQRQDWAGAARRYGMAIEGFGPGDTDSYVAQIALGRVQRKAGQDEAAATTLRAAHDLDPDVPWALLELAQLHHDDRLVAEPFLESAREIAPNQPYVDIVAAQLCAGWADYACAEESYRRAEERRPNSGWLQGRIGDFYRPDAEPLPYQNLGAATEAYAEAVQRRPNDPWAHERLAFARYASGEFPEAAVHFDVSLNELSHPKSQLAERYCTLAQAQQSAGMSDVALDNYQICHDKLEDPAMKATVESLMEPLLEVEDSTFE